MHPMLEPVMTGRESGEELAEFVQEKLSVPRGVLALLKETQLFGPVIEIAIEDLDRVIEKVAALKKK